MAYRRVKAVEIIQEFAKVGVSLEEDEQGLLIYQPGSPVTPEMVDQLRIYKKEICEYLAFLSLCDNWDEGDVEPVEDWCPMYRHPRAWKSIYGDHLICGTCHPPVSDKVVSEWIERKVESQIRKPGDNGDNEVGN